VTTLSISDSISENHERLSISENHARLVRRLDMSTELNENDKELLSTLPLRVSRLPPHSEIVREGDHPHDSVLVLDGLVSRYRMLGDGTRQILSLHFPGDLPDLQSLYIERMDHSLSTFTAARVGYIPHEALRELSAREPRIGRALMTHCLADAAIFREWIVNLGRRPAIARMAHLFCELYVRLKALDLITADSMELPLTQTDLADALGLSTVHVNRVLQALRHDGVIYSDGRRHRVVDWERLKLVAGFDQRYLHMRNGFGI
jgi:CRP-like cAMP-binding protein